MLRLKELRKERGMTQEALAQLLGVTQETLSGWENEKFDMSISMLKRCASLFGVSTDYMLGVAAEKGSEVMEEKTQTQEIKIVITVDDSDVIRAKNNAVELRELLKTIGKINSID